MEQGGFFNIPGLFGMNNDGFITTPGIQFQENLAKQQLRNNGIKPTIIPPMVDRMGNVGQVTQEQLQQGIGGAYNLETGEMKPTGLLGMFSDISDSFSNMSADETTNLLQGLSGLLSQTAPAQQELQRISIPSATAGLRLPEVDLMQYYKGLL